MSTRKQKTVIKDVVDIFISGPQGCGKTAIMGKILKALQGEFPKLEICVCTTNTKVMNLMVEDAETVES